MVFETGKNLLKKYTALCIYVKPNVMKLCDKVRIHTVKKTKWLIKRIARHIFFQRIH